jgi:hypothetical protein
LSSATVSLYSFGDTGPRMKSPWASTFLFFSTASQRFQIVNT